MLHPFQSSFHNYRVPACLNSSLAPWVIPALANWVQRRPRPSAREEGGEWRGRRIHLTVQTTKPWLRSVGTSGQHRNVILVFSFGSMPKHEIVIFGLIPPERCPKLRGPKAEQNHILEFVIALGNSPYRFTWFCGMLYICFRFCNACSIAL